MINGMINIFLQLNLLLFYNLLINLSGSSKLKQQYSILNFIVMRANIV